MVIIDIPEGAKVLQSTTAGAEVPKKIRLLTVPDLVDLSEGTRVWAAPRRSLDNYASTYLIGSDQFGNPATIHSDEWYDKTAGITIYGLPWSGADLETDDDGSLEDLYE